MGGLKTGPRVDGRAVEPLPLSVPRRLIGDWCLYPSLSCLTLPCHAVLLVFKPSARYQRTDRPKQLSGTTVLLKLFALGHYKARRISK